MNDPFQMTSQAQPHCICFWFGTNKLLCAMNDTSNHEVPAKYAFQNTATRFAKYSYHGFLKEHLLTVLTESINNKNSTIMVVTVLEMLGSGWYTQLWQDIWKLYISMLNVKNINGCHYLLNKQKQLQQLKKEQGLSIIDLRNNQLIRNHLLEVVLWLAHQPRINLKEIATKSSFKPSPETLEEWLIIDPSKSLSKDAKICVTQIIEAISQGYPRSTLHWLNLLVNEQPEAIQPFWNYLLLEADKDDHPFVKTYRSKSDQSSAVPALYGTILLIYYRDMLKKQPPHDFYTAEIVQGVIKSNIMQPKILSKLSKMLETRPSSKLPTKLPQTKSKKKYQIDTATIAMQQLKDGKEKRRKH